MFIKQRTAPSAFPTKRSRQCIADFSAERFTQWTGIIYPKEWEIITLSKGRRLPDLYQRILHRIHRESILPLVIKCDRVFILKRHPLLKCLLILSHIIYRIPDVHISNCAAVRNCADSPYRNICDAEHLCQLDFIGDASCIFIP